MTEKSQSHVSIGSIGGSIIDSSIAGRDINTTAAAAPPPDGVASSLKEIREALTALLPAVANDLGGASPAATHLGDASSATLDDAIAKTATNMDKPTATEVKSKLDQVKAMLEMIVNGAEKVPTAVAKAEDGAVSVLARLTELATKVGSLALIVGKMFN